MQPKPIGCFGAGQPKPQSCDPVTPKDDDCDGRVDAPDGKNLAVKGMTCGINVGQCKAGLVTACDMTKTNCFEAFGRTPAATQWYVCSTAAPDPITVCPTAEVCNGHEHGMWRRGEHRHAPRAAVPFVIHPVSREDAHLRVTSADDAVVVLVTHGRGAAGLRLTANESRVLANVLNATARRVEGRP